MACARYETRWVPDRGGLIPIELLNMDKALAEAREKGLDEACPEEYRAAAILRSQAYQTYGTCNTKGSIELAKEAMAQIADLCPDSDGDGVMDKLDRCPGTPKGIKVDAKGCPLDTDGDGIYDSMDQCPGTPKGVKVDGKGCPLDTDGDGVYDYLDKCPGTPKGVKVDAKGCPLDTDGDGVYDYLDKCPDTPKGVTVDAKGCPLDTDGDGVYDYLDKCPGTPKSAKVDGRGCWVLLGVYFDTAKWNIKALSIPILDEVVSVLKKNPSLRVEVQGHTDNRGSKSHNQRLSENRARSVMGYFISKGIEKGRLTPKGFGFSKPVASNENDMGRSINRRVELKPLP